MKREKKLVEQRQKAILAVLKEQKKVLVDVLAQKFETSSMTIRRDLQVLEQEGYVRRFYGGAELLGQEAEQGEDSRINYRRELARYAASLVDDGDTIFINGSSTALMIAEELQNKKVRIITNNLDCMRCKAGKNVTFILTGGDLSCNERVLVGDFAMNNLLQVRANKSFLGFAGISDSGDVFCDVSLEISAHQLMMNHSDQFYIILDHEKIGRVASGPICSLEKGGVLITDQKSDPEILERLRQRGMEIKVIYVQ